MTVPAVALTQVRGRVDSALRAFAGQQRAVLLSAGDELLPGIEAMTGLLAGGQQHRPLLAGKRPQRAVHPVAHLDEGDGGHSHGGETKASRSLVLRACEPGGFPIAWAYVVWP